MTATFFVPWVNRIWMDIFKLYHENKKGIPLIKGFPEGELYQKYKMGGATDYYYARIDKRNLMLFIHFDLGEMGFWRSRYLFKDNFTIHCYSSSECLEQHNLLIGETLYRLQALAWRRLKAGKCNLLYLREVYNEVRFRGEMDTLDVHFTKEYLYSLGEEHPRLRPLIEEVKEGKASSLFEEFSMNTPKSYYTIVLLMELLDMNNMPISEVKSLGKKMITDHIYSGDNQMDTKYSYTYSDIEIFRQISLELDYHMDQSGILTKVIHDCYLNRGKLTEGFKLVFNCTPRSYLFIHRVIRATDLLFKNYSLKDICDITGYTNTSHLNDAFNRYYGISINKFRLRIQ